MSKLGYPTQHLRNQRKHQVSNGNNEEMGKHP